MLNSLKRAIFKGWTFLSLPPGTCEKQTTGKDGNHTKSKEQEGSGYATQLRGYDSVPRLELVNRLGQGKSSELQWRDRHGKHKGIPQVHVLDFDLLKKSEGPGKSGGGTLSILA